MKKGKAAGKVQHYVPRALYARYRALEKRAAAMRQESNKSISTRVTFQEQDFKLLWRPKNQKPGWNVEPHPEGLPGFRLDTLSGTLQLNALKLLQNGDSKTKLMVATAVIQSKLQYLMPLWGGAPDYLLHELQVQQLKAARLVWGYGSFYWST